LESGISDLLLYYRQRPKVAESPVASTGPTILGAAD
jgi:hypothetical protein